MSFATAESAFVCAIRTASFLVGFGTSAQRRNRNAEARLAGIAGSLALSRLLATLVYELRPNDPVTLASAAVVLSTPALIACWFPARRATSVDPLALLRYE